MTLEFKLNSDLEKIQNWLHSNKLTLNNKNTKYAIIGSRYKLNNLNHDFNVSVDNREIERVTSYKYLGVEIDEKLSWRNHTDSLCKKVSAGIGAIKRVRHLVPGQTQPRSQGLSSLPPLSFLNDNGGREERPWERGWVKLSIKCMMPLWNLT